MIAAAEYIRCYCCHGAIRAVCADYQAGRKLEINNTDKGEQPMSSSSGVAERSGAEAILDDLLKQLNQDTQ
jgi:hypothetical protein